MFSQSFWIVPLKTTSIVDLFWKEMSRKHFLSCLDSVFSLTVYINPELLEVYLFSFLHTWNPNTSFELNIFFQKLWKATYAVASFNELYSVKKLYQWLLFFFFSSTFQDFSLSQGNGKHGHAYFCVLPLPQEYKVSLYTASKISRHKHLLRKRNHNMKHLLKIWQAHSSAVLIEILWVRC